MLQQLTLTASGNEVSLKFHIVGVAPWRFFLIVLLILLPLNFLIQFFFFDNFVNWQTNV